MGLTALSTNQSPACRVLGEGRKGWGLTWGREEEGGKERRKRAGASGSGLGTGGGGLWVCSDAGGCPPAGAVVLAMGLLPAGAAAGQTLN